MATQTPDDLIIYEQGRISGIRELRIAAVLFADEDSKSQLLHGSYWEEASGTWSLLGLALRFGLGEIAVELARHQLCPFISGELALHDTIAVGKSTRQRWWPDNGEWQALDLSFWRPHVHPWISCSPFDELFEQEPYIRTVSFDQDDIQEDDDQEDDDVQDDDQEDDDQEDEDSDGSPVAPWIGYEVCQKKLTTWPHHDKESDRPGCVYSMPEEEFKLMSVSNYCSGWEKKKSSELDPTGLPFELALPTAREFMRTPATLAVMALMESGHIECLDASPNWDSSPEHYVFWLDVAIIFGRLDLVTVLLPRCGIKRPSRIWQACDLVDISYEVLSIESLAIDLKIHHVILLEPGIVNAAIHAGADLSSLVIDKGLPGFDRPFSNPSKRWRCGLLDAAVLGGEEVAAHALYKSGAPAILLANDGTPFLQVAENGDKLALNLPAMILAADCGIDLKPLRIDLVHILDACERVPHLVGSSSRTFSLWDMSVLTGDRDAAAFLVARHMETSGLVGQDLKLKIVATRRQLKILATWPSRLVALMTSHFALYARYESLLHHWAAKCAFILKAKVPKLCQGISWQIYWYATDLAAPPQEWLDQWASMDREAHLDVPDEPNSQSESVIQLVEHREPAAHIDAEVAAIQVDLEWADHAEYQLHHAAGAPQEVSATSVQAEPIDAESIFMEPEIAAANIAAEAAESADGILLLRFGSAPTGSDGPSMFRQALLEGTELASCRHALEQAGYSCKLPEQALIFVHPDQYTDARRSLINHALHAYHVVVSASIEGLVMDVLGQIPCRKRPKLKPHAAGRIEVGKVPSDEERPDQSADVNIREDELGMWCESRTFLCSSRLRRIAHTVAQSSTEVVVEHSETHYSNYRGLNPRR